MNVFMAEKIYRKIFSGLIRAGFKYPALFVINRGKPGIKANLRDLAQKNRASALVIFIVIFWLVMTGLLLFRELGKQGNNAGYQPFLSKNTLLSDQWLGIYFNGSPVGFTHTAIEPFQIKNGVSGYRIVNRTWMNFLVLHTRNKVSFNSEAIVDDDYRMREFKFELNSGRHVMRVSGVMRGRDSIALKVDSQGAVTRRVMRLPTRKGFIVAGILSPFNSFGTLQVGRRYSVDVFNPFSLELEPLEVNIAGKEKLRVNNEDIDTFIVESNYRGIIQKSWVDSKGEMVKEETGMGWILLREDPSVAGRVYANIGKNDTELAALVSLASNVALEPANLSCLKVSLTGLSGEGFALPSQRQKIIEAEGGRTVIEISKDAVDEARALSLPLRGMPDFLKATDFVQSDDPAVRSLARSIVGTEKNSFRAAAKINQWVYKNINKIPVVSIPSAVDVLKTREGDCNEHTVLFTALSRAAEIPARMNVGIVYLNGRFYYHAWASVYVGKWVDMDPTFGQTIADAAHIRFIEGELNRQLDIIRLIGKIKLEVIESR